MHTPSPDWQAPEIVVDLFKDDGLTLGRLMRLVKLGSLTCGRALKHDTRHGGELLIYVPDVQEEIDASRAKPGGQSYAKWARHEGFTSPRGIEYRTTLWAQEHLEIHFSRQTFRRFHDDGVIMLIQKAPERVKLSGFQIPVYLGNGTWHGVWVWRKTQLLKIKRFLRTGKIVHPEFGEGVTYSEAKDMSFGRGYLRRASQKDGKGLFELGGEVLKRWNGYRAVKRKQENGEVILIVIKQREFSKTQLASVLEARRRLAMQDHVAEQGGTKELSEREVYEQYPEVFENGDLVPLRGELGARKVSSKWATPGDEGEWRYPLQTVRELATERRRKLVTRDKPYTLGGQSYIPYGDAVEVSQLSSQVFHYYCKHPHPAIGDVIGVITVTRNDAYIRRSKQEFRLYNLGHAQQIAEWEKKTAVHFLSRLTEINGPVKANDVYRLGRTAFPSYSDGCLKDHRESAGLKSKKISDNGLVFSVWHREDADPRAYSNAPALPPEYLPQVNSARVQSVQGWDQVFHGRLLVGVKQLDGADQQPASNGMTAEEIPTPTEQQAVHGAAYSIRLSGEVWHICYDQETGAFAKRGSQALGWLAKLLAGPGFSFTVADLLGDPERKLAADARMMGESETDSDGAEAIKTRLADIEEIAAETGGSEAMESEKADLLRRLQAANYGTQILNPLRKSHHNMATQIRKARDKLSESMPKLGTHLKATLRFEFPHLGYYPPSGTPAWES